MRKVPQNWNLLAAIYLLAGTASSVAGYVIDSHVETSGGTNHFSWSVYNEDQSWGLDGFAIEVPVQTRVLAHHRTSASLKSRSKRVLGNGRTI